MRRGRGIIKVVNDWRALVTRREADVLRSVERHLTNAQIAAELHLSTRTVESHVASLLRKSGAKDRRDLARRAEVADGVLGHLRTYENTLYGRHDISAELSQTLSTHRVVTLVGQGGVGKTRLAHEFVAGCRDTWEFVAVTDLLPVASGGVAASIAATLRVPERGAGLREAVAAAIGDRKVLLLIDNAEHLVAEVADFVSHVATRCARATLLVTSREALRLSPELVVAVPPLTDELEHAALALFCDRGHVREDSKLLPLIRQLEGIPLSLELAAYRLPTLGLDGLEAAMSSQLTLLEGGRDDDIRHRSASSVVAWSFDLLTEDEAHVLISLGAVRHGVDLASAALLVDRSAADVATRLAHLTAKGLLSLHTSTAGARWRMSQVVREYTDAVTATDPSLVNDRARRARVWAHQRALAAAGEPGHLPPGEELADLVRLAKAEDDHGEGGALGHLPRAVATVCARAGRLKDAVDCLLVAATSEAPLSRRAQDLLVAADFAAARATGGELSARLPLQAAELAARNGDSLSEAKALAIAVINRCRFPQSAQALALLPDPEGLLKRARAAHPTSAELVALLSLAEAWYHREVDEAEVAVGLIEGVEDPAMLAGALDALAVLLGEVGRYRDARTAALRRISVLRTASEEDPATIREMVDVRHMAARTAMVVGELAEAEDDALPGSDSRVVDAIADLPRYVRLRSLQGRFDEAIDSGDRLWDAWIRLEAAPAPWIGTAGACVVLALGLTDDPREGLWRDRTRVMGGMDDGLVPPPLLAPLLTYVDARIALHRHDYADARHLAGRCFATFSNRWYEGFARGAGAELAAAAGLDVAVALIEALDDHVRESDWADAVQRRSLGRLHEDQERFAAAASLWDRIGARFERAATASLRVG